MLGLSKYDSSFLSDTDKIQLYTEIILLDQYYLLVQKRRMSMLFLVNSRGERLNLIQLQKSISFTMLGEYESRTL